MSATKLPDWRLPDGLRQRSVGVTPRSARCGPGADGSVWIDATVRFQTVFWKSATTAFLDTRHFFGNFFLG
jgi:hypothetical protein